MIFHNLNLVAPMSNGNKLSEEHCVTPVIQGGRTYLPRKPDFEIFYLGAYTDLCQLFQKSGKAHFFLDSSFFDFFLLIFVICLFCLFLLSFYSYYINFRALLWLLLIWAIVIFLTSFPFFFPFLVRYQFFLPFLFTFSFSIFLYLSASICVINIT